ncbi:unnamed protein product [Alopecurus aequalis]
MAAPAGNEGGGANSCRQLPAVLFLLHLIISILLLGVSAEAAAAVSFRFTNACAHPVWVGALNGATSPPLSRSGFHLASGATSALAVPSPWSGNFWARTGCATDAATGRFSCATADCGSGEVACDGHGPSPPVTLAEITLADRSSSSGSGLDFYDVSLVDGFNVPLSIAPSNGGGGCRSAACAGDVNTVCPTDLRVLSGSSGGTVIACKSACNAYGSARYCCSGDYGTPAACGPTNYSRVFKTACPAAYSYAYDDASSTFTCSGAAAYQVTFCPAT